MTDRVPPWHGITPGLPERLAAVEAAYHTTTVTIDGAEVAARIVPDTLGDPGTWPRRAYADLGSGVVLALSRLYDDATRSQAVRVTDAEGRTWTYTGGAS